VELLLERWQWTIVVLLCLLALWIRVAPRFSLVFHSGFVNFQGGDAWYHVRGAENLVRHFPFRIAVDPYLTYGRVQPTATLPTYDWILGSVAWVAGAGAPSDSLLHVVAAWYPAR
jgi:asparagine N-glycosylation enzyme membrane subunit Stt3